MVEYQHRRDTAATKVPLADVAAWVQGKIRHVPPIPAR
ncbi:MAG: hypothetical protein ACXWAC_10825 [Usitatibacter sp.]